MLAKLYNGNPRTPSLEDADTESLWEACSDTQRQSIMDSFTSFYAGQITLELSEGKVTAALRTWTTHRDEKLEQLAQDGEITLGEG